MVNALSSSGIPCTIPPRASHGLSQPPEFDEVIVARARSGDRRALDELAGRCRPLVYRWGLVQTGSPDDAEDIAQTVLVQLVTRLETFRGEARFTTWLYRVTRRVVAQSVRGLRRRQQRLQRHALELDPEPVTEVDDGLDTRRLAAVARAAFDLLPPRQRELLDLVDLQGYSAAEASRMLEIEPATARVHLLRARRAVRARMLETHTALVEDRIE